MEGHDADRAHSWVNKQLRKVASHSGHIDELFVHVGAMEKFLMGCVQEFFALETKRKTRAGHTHTKRKRHGSFAEYMRKFISPEESRILHLEERGFTEDDIAKLLKLSVEEARHALLVSHRRVAKFAEEFYG